MLDRQSRHPQCEHAIRHKLWSRVGKTEITGRALELSESVRGHGPLPCTVTVPPRVVESDGNYGTGRTNAFPVAKVPVGEVITWLANVPPR